MKSDLFIEIKTAPDIISLEVIGSSTVHIKWCPAVGADRYIVKRSREQNGKYEKIASLSIKVTDYFDDTIDAEGIYWYKITARKKNGDQKPLTKHSEARSVEVIRIPTVTLEKLRFSDDGVVSLNWTEEPSVDGYIVYRRYSFMPAPIKIGETVSATCAFDDVSITKGQLYYYSVRGFLRRDGALLFSDPSNEQPFVSLSAPAVIKTVRLHRKRIRFFFRLTAGADGYAVLRSKEKDGEYRQTAKTQGKLVLDCTDCGEKKQKGAYYKFACLKDVDGKEVLGDVTEPVYIKYKL